MAVLRTWMFVLTWLAPAPAHAYIGPGAGISAVGSLLVLIGAVLLSIVGFVWFPVRRLMKNRGKARMSNKNKNGGSSS